ncbi:MAG TPA: stage II sporulation protein D [Tenericutes bacterium]|nr:stage II sporulation protein D [Mycoplasmatota bacterium]
MFASHYITENNGIKTLYLSLNHLNSEFSKEFLSSKDTPNKPKFSDHILSYIKENKIKFQSGTIKLLAGGVIISELIMPSPKKIISAKNLKKEEIKKEKVINILNEEEILENPIFEVEENFPEENIETNTKSKILVDESQKVIDYYSVLEGDNLWKISNRFKISIDILKTINNLKTNIIYPGQILLVNPNLYIEKKKKEVIPEKRKVKEKEKNDTFNVSVIRSSGTVDVLSLEDYVVGVVAAEMPALFEEEALKAQAVVSRTYALKRLKNSPYLTDNLAHQNFLSKEELKELWQDNFEIYYKKIKKAVKETEGLVITYTGEIIDALFFSTSNGYTQSSKYLWGKKDVPYLKGVKSSWDLDAVTYLGNKRIPRETFFKELDLEIEKLIINFLSFTDGGYIDDIEINGKIFKGNYIRDIFKLRSADFDIIENENDIVFITRGYGHGVGMSQYGANGMAKEGFLFEDIIKHYYQGIKIEKKDQ